MNGNITNNKQSRDVVFSRYQIFIVVVLINLQLFSTSGNTGQLPSGGFQTSGSSSVKKSTLKPPVTSACHITVEQAHRYIRSKSVLLVDIRSEESYRQSTIPGAINIPLFAIKTRSFLKGKHLVLFDDGSNLPKLVGECRELVSKYGMKISVLKGGIRQWNNGGKGKGILYKLTPDDYLASINVGRWVIIDASGNKEARAIFSGSQLIDFAKIESNDLTEITSAIKQGKDIVVLTDHGESTQQLAEVQKRFDQPVFLLTGGVIGYADFLSNRERFLSRLERGPVKAVQCVK